ncbi:hypothetical protein [Derxia lacustris]|uniref:hypothetical protein n=1 Tax=Derxia lacustris TaxID=764842 RepID=UPI001594BA69|nr:hypothetical protein [Derxia lacustris]
MTQLSSPPAAPARGPIASAGPLLRLWRLFVATLVVGAPIAWGVGALGLLGHWVAG